LLYIDRVTCTGCAVCLDTCPTGAIGLDEREGVATIDQVLCTECLACLDACPTGAVRQIESSELVPAGTDEIVEGQVIERQMIPARASKPLIAAWQPDRLATLAGTALTFVGSWLLPRAADAFLDAVERRLARRTSPTSSAATLRPGNSPLSKQIGNGRSRPGRHRRRRWRGR